MSDQQLRFRYEQSACRAAWFSAQARDPITHELARHYQREAAKLAILLALKDKMRHHYGMTGHHMSSRLKHYGILKKDDNVG